LYYQILDWDSAFFGVGVANISDAILSVEELTGVLAELKNKSVKLVYWASERGLDDGQAAKLCGHLVDIRTTFVANFRCLDPRDVIRTDIVEVYSSSMPVSELEDLAIQSGEYSRFAADPCLPREKFVSLYKIWINRSLRKEVANETLVIRDAHRVVGMVTLAEKDGRGDIGLLAVDATCRRKHYGESLVRAAQKWFIKNGYELGQVVTQGKNIAACNLYKKCNYSVESIQYFYHFWLSPGPRSSVC
jgi:dTDP-4-amino-4,6-dideoxy-D-galactose acyltransferase